MKKKMVFAIGATLVIGSLILIISQPTPDSDELIISYEWEYGGNDHRLDASIERETYLESISSTHSRSPNADAEKRGDNILSFLSPYSNEYMDYKLGQLADDIEMLYEAHSEHSRQGLANFVLFFVQSTIIYADDLEQYLVPDYIAFPLETFVNGKGDCEDTALLYSAIMYNLGFDIGLVVFPTHVISLVSIADFVDASSDGYEKYAIGASGKMFYGCESTPGEFIPVGLLDASLTGDPNMGLTYLLPHS